MKILITTQYRENYGTESDPYWKNKGGDEYYILNVDPLKTAPGLLVEQVRDRVEYTNPRSEESILDWQLVPDDFQTDFERDQLLFDGEIRYPTHVIELEAA